MVERVTAADPLQKEIGGGKSGLQRVWRWLTARSSGGLQKFAHFYG